MYEEELLQYGLEIANSNKMSLRMKNHHHPISITEDEFFFIKDYVAQRNYLLAYEIATGFGVSSCAIGLGMPFGKVISCDSYIEEQFNLASAYQTLQKEIYKNSDGYRTALQLSKHFGLNIDYKIGWSPAIDEVLGEFRPDFAFIDAAHYDKNLLVDIAAIYHRMSKPYTIMIHDVGAFSEFTIKTLELFLGVKMILPTITRSYGIGYFQVNR